MVNNERRIGHLTLVKGPSSDAIGGLLKNAVAGINTTAHDKIDHYRPLAVGTPAQGNAPARVRILTQQLKKLLHFTAPP